VKKQCSVYWLFELPDSDVREHGYVGVSWTPRGRIREHRRSGRFPPFQHRIIFVGSETACYDHEEFLRPEPLIGWNLASGGARPKLPEETREKLSKALALIRGTLAARELTRKQATERWDDEEYKARVSESIRLGKTTPEAIERQRQIAINNNSDPVISKKIADGIEAYWLEEANREARGAIMREVMK
jgi:hypothetical protein